MAIADAEGTYADAWRCGAHLAVRAVRTEGISCRIALGAHLEGCLISSPPLSVVSIISRGEREGAEEALALVVAVEVGLWWSAVGDTTHRESGAATGLRRWLGGGGDASCAPPGRGCAAGLR
jgi:hypothetical protein